MVVLILIHTLSSAFKSSSASCNDVHDCRTVPSIIFNCASTVFLCTWVALHLDVPKDPRKAWWKRCLHRIKWVMIALLAPEAVFGRAFIEWAKSCDDLKEKLSEFGPTIGQPYVLSLQCVLHCQGMIRLATGQKHMQCWRE